MGHQTGRARNNWNKLRNALHSRKWKESFTKRIIELSNVEYYEGSADGHDISQVVITINDYLLQQQQQPHNSSKQVPSIYRVPKSMRELRANDYDPNLVSIGPIHRNQPHLQSMQEHKLRFLSRLLRSPGRTTDDDHKGLVAGPSSPQPSYWVGQDGQDIEKLAIAMKVSEKVARDSYSETFSDIGSRDFILMMIIDGCFIIELLRLYDKSDKEYIDDPIFTTRWMVPILQRDLLMLENQLPFSVLQALFQLTVLSKGEGSPSLTELILNFFDPLLPREQKMLDKCKTYLATYNIDFYHLLGVFRSSFLLSFKNSKSQDKERKKHYQTTVVVPPVHEKQLINCVTELREAGISFEGRQCHDLLDIKFKKGVLKIPPVLIDDHTSSVFLNFVAYEQCFEYAEPYFTHYVLFFDSLVNSFKDVELLHYSGIISHILGSDEEVAKLFNELCKEVVYDVDDCYLAEILKNVNNYYDTEWHKWRASCMHNYFSSPWSILSLFAAIFLLLLTVIQSVFSILSYVRPPS